MTDSVRSKWKKTALYFLFGYFFSTTFSHALGQNFLGFTLLFIIIVLIKEKKFRPDFSFGNFTKIIFVYVGWSIISAVFSPSPGDSFINLREEWLFLMIPAVAFLCDDEKIVRRIYTIFAISIILISLYAVWQHFSGIDLYRDRDLIKAPSYGYSVRGFFSHRLTFGNYFAIAAIFILGAAPYAENIKSKILLYAAFIMASIAVVFTYSRGPILTLIVGILLFLLWVGRRKLKPIIVIIAALVIVVIFAAPDVTDRYVSSFKIEMEGKYAGSRLSIWRTAWRMALDNPILGVGVGNFFEEYPNYRDIGSDRAFSHAHNDVLNAAANCGFPYAIIYLSFWLVMIVRIIRYLKNLRGESFPRGVGLGCLLASLVFFMTSVYEATFADEETRLLLMAIWGLFIGMERLVKRETKLTENIEKA
jgi:O-antigen ligase